MNYSSLLKNLKTAIGVSAWIFIIAMLACIFVPIFADSGSRARKKSQNQDYYSDMFRNDNLVAVTQSDGSVKIINEESKKTTMKGVKIDWTQDSSNDSLAVFCAENKRGYYNVYTGEVAIPAQYRRAWVFSEGLAAVQKNGMIGFIDSKGNTIIDFNFPFHGNPLREFVFEKGKCIVANSEGLCGVINKKGEWLIRPEYDYVRTYEDYAIVSKAGERLQVGYDGTVINSFVLDGISRLTYTVEERCENRDGEIMYVNKKIDTDLFSYRVGGRCGLMDAKCHRITEPLYQSIEALDKNMFRATLFDYYSEVILNEKGEFMR